MANLNYKNREFELVNQVKDNKLERVVIKDGGIEFPFPNYTKAAEFLSEEYGGNVEEAVKALNECESIEGLETSDVPAKTTPDKNEKSGKGKGKGKGKTKEEKEAEKAKKEADKKAKEDAKKQKEESKEMIFNLPAGPYTKTVAFKTILPDQKTIRVEDIVLDEKHGLHIDVYSEKNRTCVLYAFNETKPVTTKGKNGGNEHEVDLITNYPECKGDVLIEKVALMDAIYKYAEVAGLSFQQADKYIKIMRGLLPAPEKKAKDEAVTADSLKGDKTNKEDAKKEDAKKEDAKKEDAPGEAPANADEKVNAEAN